MKSPQSETSPSSNVRNENIQRELSKLIDLFKAETRRVDDRRFRGLLEKSSEVLKGLRTLFERFAAANPERRETQPTPTRRKDGARKVTSPVKANGNKKTAPLGKSGVAGSRAVGKNTPQSNGKTDAPTSNGRAAKAENRSQKDRMPAQSASSATQQPVASTPTVAVAKPQDPDAIAAQEQIQRKEARAPKGPVGYSAPRPAPPQSGKPVWSKPHSS
jgi:hypothetical protein